MLTWGTVSEAQHSAVQKYKAKKFDRQEIYLPKGFKQRLKEHAKTHQPQEGKPGKPGYIPRGSVNAFINRAIREAMIRDAYNTKIAADVKQNDNGKSRAGINTEAEMIKELTEAELNWWEVSTV